MFPPKAVAEKFAYTVISAAAIVAGAVPLKNEDNMLKLIGGLLHLLPPGVMIGALAMGSQGVDFCQGLASNPALVWSMIVVLAVLSVLSATVTLSSKAKA